MPRKTLTVEVLADPANLAASCRRYGAGGWSVRGGCPFPAVECPLMGGAVPCEDVEAWMWEELLDEEPESKPRPEPEFHFGDKVTHHIDFPVEAVFSAYKDSRHSGEAYVLFDDGPECQVVLVRNLKAGWE